MTSKARVDDVIDHFQPDFFITCKVLCVSTMADTGKLMKMEVDHSETVDKRLPECQEMAKVNSRFAWCALIRGVDPCQSRFIFV